MEKKEYRPDIDVLRAIAVLAVVFYHAHIPYFYGGYVGVSIFFVISGYLITGIIKRKLENNSFSFLEFYENRIRRILPALFVIVFCTTIISWLTAINITEMQQLFSSAKRVLLTIPNIYFYQNTNYFDPAAETLPLLHTWSLGVEEQFYFVMPALLFFLYKILKGKIQIIHILWGLCILSFISSLILIQYNQKFTFYMLPTRAWELLMGSILAYTNWTPKSQKNKLLCRVIGLILITYPIIFYGNILFPGIWALPPCLGACLYIAGGKNAQKSILNHITHNKLLVFIGLISYSVYLWHWPIFVYYQNFPFRREMPLSMGLTLSGLTLIIAGLSWKFIETPIRHNPFFKKKYVAWIMAILLIAPLLTFVSQVKAPHIPELSTQYIFNSKQNTLTQTQETQKTTFGVPSQNNTLDFVLIGDSHAGMLSPLFQELSEKYGLFGKILKIRLKSAYNANAPLPEINNSINNQKELTELYQHYHVKNLFISFRLIWHVTGTDIIKSKSHISYIKYYYNPELPPMEALYHSLKETIEDANKNHVQNIFIQIPVPETKGFVLESASKLSSLFKKTNQEINKILAETYTEYENRMGEINNVLYKLEQEFPNVHILNVLPYFKNDKEQLYNVMNDNIIYYIDDDHLCYEGANLIRPLYENAFKKYLLPQKE